MKKRVLVALIVVLAVAAYPLLRALRGLSDARNLAAQQEWSAARERLESYLWVRPGDERALLLMAEALVREQQPPEPATVNRALDCLRSIPDTSAVAAAARTQEGSLLLLLKHQPGAAENALRKAVALDSGMRDAWYLLWKLHDLTGRVAEAEPVFWEVFELTPEPKRAEQLREWYLSQFNTTGANPALDRVLGVLGAGEHPSRASEKKRYEKFRDAEPDSPIPHAALARWHLTAREFDSARNVLRQAGESVPAEMQDHPFYLAVLIGTLIELGDLDEAAAAMGRWPQGDRGFEYWRCRALVLDEVQGDDEQAVVAFDQALQIWPGPAEWALLNRKANCLTRLGRPAEAAEARAAASRVVGLMTADVHQSLTNALLDLQAPGPLMQVAEYYQKLGRAREASSWRQCIARL